MATGATFTTSSHYYYRDLGSTLAYPFAILCWFDMLSATATHRFISGVYDPSKTGTAGIHLLGVRTSIQIAANTYDDSAVTNGAFYPTVYTVGPYYQACVNMAANNSRTIIVNGDLANVVTQASVRNVASPTRVGVGTRVAVDNQLPFNGRIYQAAWVNRAVTNAEAQALAKGMSPLELGRSLIAYMPAMGLQDTAVDVMTGGTFTGNAITAVEGTAPPNLHHEWLV